MWVQHENGIWPDSQNFIAMLKDLDMPKVVTLHTLHFQSTEMPSGLRRYQYDLLRTLLPRVEAITGFSRGVYSAVTSALPEHRDKVSIIKHGIHSYPEVRRLSRRCTMLSCYLLLSRKKRLLQPSLSPGDSLFI